MIDISRSFGLMAQTYDEFRPPYPPELLDPIEAAVGGFAGRRVLDLAAGTGMGTRHLIGRGASVVAVEPDSSLLSLLIGKSPGVDAVRAIGERLPFVSNCFDAVTCATAWHWLDISSATIEVARVLRPGGSLALWWANHLSDPQIEWEARQSAVYQAWDALPGSIPLDPLRGGEPQAAAADLRSRGWQVRLDDRIFWTREVTREEHLAVLSTHSVVIGLGPDKQRFLDTIAAALEPWPLLTERLNSFVVVASPPRVADPA